MQVKYLACEDTLGNNPDSDYVKIQYRVQVEGKLAQNVPED